MTKNILFLTLFILFASVSKAQQPLYMPRDISEAYKNGTRSLDGKPGKNYWQNRARYNITVSAAPPDRAIKGTEEITYFNNSPDTIRNPVFKLFINIHKPGAPRLGGAGPEYLNEGVNVDAFSINGKAANFPNNPFVFTNARVGLPAPLLPHDSIHFSVNWHYTISLQSNREGMIDSTSYFLAYFYPRVSVFDDYNGWDRMNFTDAQEFYSDFNDYTVTVNVPKNYLVWGTGTIQHPETLLQPEYLKRFNASLTSDQSIQIVTKSDLATKNVTTQKAVNSWQFKATNVPDMAFGLSDHFVWDGCSVVVDDATHRRASAQAAYNDTAADYHHVASYAAHALDWLSHNWPGVPYPYEKTTVFQGYAGMEYPMMANDETYADTLFSRFVAEHEIAHTYMPFYMGINETRYGFMDEGWATTFEILIGRADMGVQRAEEFYKQFRVDGWSFDKSSDEDVPIITPGDDQTGQGLGNNEYGKPSLGYLAVKDILGDALFKKCLHEYMDRWHGKHPIPWDFFYTINDASGKNLNWFWSNWFFSNHYIDLAVESVKSGGGGYTLVVKNIGGMANPFDVKIKYTDGTKESLHQTASVWEQDQQNAKIQVTTKKKIQSLTLDGGIYVDANDADNSWSQ